MVFPKPESPKHSYIYNYKNIVAQKYEALSYPTRIGENSYLYINQMKIYFYLCRHINNYKTQCFKFSILICN